ncbi:MAG: hypothetical protein SWQ30_17375 [Thermodesulfobacteriota bacterium]|nr:hypothetical protein [Thermodesulfobacteriota bacterium]
MEARSSDRKLPDSMKEFVDSLDLSGLYRLARSIADVRDSLSWMGLQLDSAPPSLEEAKAVFADLENGFPEFKDYWEFGRLAERVCQVYSAEETEDVKHAMAAHFVREGGTEEGALPYQDRSLYRKKEIVSLVREELAQVSVMCVEQIKADTGNPIEKAETYLRENVAASIDRYGDQEAVVYLRSRGHECLEQADEIARDWKYAADAAIREFARGHEVHHLGGDRDGEREVVGKRPLEEAADVGRWFPYLLRNFWGGHDQEELTIDATMLRTAEWCKIGGFGVWWQRWAEQIGDLVAHGGSDSGPAGAIWVFGLSRSDLAISLLGPVLGHALWALQLGTEDRSRPWVILRERGNGGRMTVSQDFCPAIASAVVFAMKRIGEAFCDYEVFERACDSLLQAQRPDGSWNWFESWDRSSIEGTAMAVHALTIARPAGWERAARQARDWLLEAQNPFGYWWEDGASGAAPFLTVLVLDAIELAAQPQIATPRVTFELASGHVAPSKAFPGLREAAGRGGTTYIMDQSRTYHIKHSHVGIAGDVVHSRIEDSFNQAAARAPEGQLTEKLGELKTLVEELLHEIPDETAATVARDFADLAEESSSKAPRKKRLEVTAEGLIEAAGCCAQLAAPIATATKAILSLIP